MPNHMAVLVFFPKFFPKVYPTIQKNYIYKNKQTYMYIHSAMYRFLIFPFGNLEKRNLIKSKAKEMALLYYNMVNFSVWI